jgi:hypothetical protein
MDLQKEAAPPSTTLWMMMLTLMLLLLLPPLPPLPPLPTMTTMARSYYALAGRELRCGRVQSRERSAAARAQTLVSH